MPCTRALESAGKNVTVTVLQGEDHWLSRTETRLQVLKDLEAFLGKHL
jgi:dipeptidyl aminopeptidase/acylaminoacyl peptidase